LCHGSLNFLFQVALHLPFWVQAETVCGMDAVALWRTDDSFLAVEVQREPFLAREWGERERREREGDRAKRLRALCPLCSPRHQAI
jgi:hypothetical protein